MLRMQAIKQEATQPQTPLSQKGSSVPGTPLSQPQTPLTTTQSQGPEDWSKKSRSTVINFIRDQVAQGLAPQNVIEYILAADAGGERGGGKKKKTELTNHLIAANGDWNNDPWFQSLKVLKPNFSQLT